jgi:hypothetical protein
MSELLDNVLVCVIGQAVVRGGGGGGEGEVGTSQARRCADLQGALEGNALEGGGDLRGTAPEPSCGKPPIGEWRWARPGLSRFGWCAGFGMCKVNKGERGQQPTKGTRLGDDKTRDKRRR